MEIIANKEYIIFIYLFPKHSNFFIFYFLFRKKKKKSNKNSFSQSPTVCILFVSQGRSKCTLIYNMRYYAY